MRSGEISAKLGIAQARPVVVLDPGQPERGKVGRGPEAGLVLQDLEGERADLEGNGGFAAIPLAADGEDLAADRSEEHTSELQSLMRISYAVFCLKKKKTVTDTYTYKSRHKNTYNDENCDKSKSEYHQYSL